MVGRGPGRALSRASASELWCRKLRPRRRQALRFPKRAEIAIRTAARMEVLPRRCVKLNVPPSIAILWGARADSP